MLGDMALMFTQNIHRKGPGIHYGSVAPRSFFNTDEDQGRIERHGAKRRNRDPVEFSVDVPGRNDRNSARKAGESVSEFIWRNRHVI